jgi:hypothetical protein
LTLDPTEIEPARRRRLAGSVLAAGALVGAAAFVYYFSHGMTTAHYDAKAHLVVARRIFDSFSPGYHQMGAQWLPLIHLLYLPFVFFESQYRTGLLPSLLSVCAFALSGWAVFRLALRATGSVEAGIFAAVILLANANLQYIQACPLTEPVALLLLILSVDAFMCWRESGGSSLPWQTAVWVSLGGLCRYEGWYVFAGILAMVAADVVCRRIPLGKALAASATLVASFAAPLLFHFGLIYFRLGDSFLHRVVRGNPSPYLTYKNPLLSAVYHLGELAQITALIPLILSLAGVAVALRNRDKLQQALPLFLLWIPSLTNISALYWGLIYRVRYSVLLVPAIAVFAALPSSEAARRRMLMIACLAATALPWVPWMFPHEWEFHEVYPGPGLMLIPAAGLILFCLGTVYDRRRWPLLALAVLAMQIPAVQGENRPILEETGEHAFIQPEWWQVVRHLQAHYDGSPILLDLGKLAPLAYDTRLPLHSFLCNEGDGRALWQRALNAPASVAGWICALKGDELWEMLRVDPQKADGYSLAVQTDNFRLYHLKSKEPGALLNLRPQP